MLNEILTYLLQGILVIFVLIIIYVKIKKKTGEKLVFEKKLEESEARWGSKQLKELTYDSFIDLFKFKNKDGNFLKRRKFYIGFEKIGKIYKIINLEKDFIVIYLKKGFIFKKSFFFIFKKEELSSFSKKELYFNTSNLTNIQGVYTTLYELKNKNEYLKNIVNDELVNDTLGRITAISGNTIFYDLQHAKENNLLKERGEILKGELKQRNKNMWDNG